MNPAPPRAHGCPCCSLKSLSVLLWRALETDPDDFPGGGFPLALRLVRQAFAGFPRKTQVTFHDYAGRQAHEAIQAILTSVSAPLRKEVDALVEDLSGAAEREAEQAAVRARRDAELAAEMQLASAQAAAEAQLARERADSDELRRTIGDLQAQMQAAADAERTALQAVRAEMTRALDEAQAAHAALSASLAAAQQDVAAAQRALAISEERLALEQRQRTAAGESLEISQRAATAARAEADAYRLDLGARCAHVQTLQQQLAQQHADAAPLARLQRALRAIADLTRASDVLETFVDELAREFDRVALFTVRENRLEGLRSVGFEPTTDIGNLVIPLTIESPLTRAASQQTSIMVPGGAEGPVTGLLGHETHCVVAIPLVTTEGAVAVAYAELARALPVEGQRVAWQIAELLGDYVTGALARAQQSTATPADDAPVTALVGHDDGGAAPASGLGTPLQPSFPGPVRAADRVSVLDTVEVLVDGGTAQLVDISLLGAQVLCTKAIRPTHRVRLVLPLEGQAVPCQGRVVWAVFEIVPSGGRYRAGLQFINVDTNAVEAFLNQQLARNHRKPEPQAAHCRS